MMVINEILIEKDKVQRKLARNSTDMHDYFKKAHESAKQLSKKHGIALSYQKLHSKSSKGLTKSALG